MSKTPSPKSSKKKMSRSIHMEELKKVDLSREISFEDEKKIHKQKLKEALEEKKASKKTGLENIVVRSKNSIVEDTAQVFAEHVDKHILSGVSPQHKELLFELVKDVLRGDTEEVVEDLVEGVEIILTEKCPNLFEKIWNCIFCRKPKSSTKQ